MILKALYDYYHRCSDNLAPKGMEYKEIPFLIVIDNEGSFLRIEDCRIDKKHCSTFLVPKAVQRSGSKSGMSPYSMWDNTCFVIGLEKDGKENPKGQYLDAFIEKVKELSYLNPNSVGIAAVKKFYEKYKQKDLLKVLERDTLFSEINDPTKYISFRLEGETTIVAEDILLNDSSEEEITDDSENICLVTGKKTKIARIHSKTPLQGNSKTSLISYNANSYESYGKVQSYNASVSEEAEFAYTTALNTLLGKDSHNKFSIGNRTFLFWASSTNEMSKTAEESLFALFGQGQNNEDPNRGLEYVKNTFLSIYNGKRGSEKDDKFYILGLAPNSARIAVVYWSEIPLREFAGLILRHFNDMEIVDTRKEKRPYAGLHSILGAVTLGGKSSDATPNLPDAVVKSIFQGFPYPMSLYQSCIRRIRAEQEVMPYGNPARVAILKAFLNRLKDDDNKKIEIMLDKNNSNVGYLCGRLFAVLDKVQNDANNISSIKDRYLNAASATPSSVFPTILNLSSHHMEKLSQGSQIFYEKIKQEIMGMMSADGFPSHLDLQDQGRFFIGYYHQRQDFFMSKKEDNVTE